MKNNSSSIHIDNHLSAMKKNLDKVISDGSKQIGFNLSTYDSLSNPRGSMGNGFYNQRNSSSIGLKGINEPMIHSGTKTIMNGFHRNSQTYFGEVQPNYKSTAINFNSKLKKGRHEKNNSQLERHLPSLVNKNSQIEITTANSNEIK